MKFESVANIIEQIIFSPLTSRQKGKFIYDFVLREGIEQCLELGFAHGTSSCYIAAALDEKGCGHLKTIDLDEGASPFFTGRKNLKPNIYELMQKTGLEKYIEPVFSDKSYTWDLMKIIDEQSKDERCKPLYDFCFIDGAHTWETDGFAFFLVAKLLKPGGWILFDDVTWSYATSPGLRNRDWVKKLPEDQRITPQIEKVFTLLVRQHPDFEEFCVQGNIAWARKKA